MLSTGVQTDQIITITIENLKDIKNLNQLRIEDLLRGKIQKNGTRQYIFIDEINQFEEVSYSYSEASKENLSLLHLFLSFWINRS